MLGIIRGHEKRVNLDGNTERIMLQVEFLPDDVRSIELMPNSLTDYVPPIGSRVFFDKVSGAYNIGVATSDNLPSTCEHGEKEIYSTDSSGSSKQAKIKLNNDGEIILNGGISSAVKWTELNNALQLLVTAINAALATKLDGGGSVGTLVLDLSLSEVSEIKL